MQTDQSVRRRLLPWLVACLGFMPVSLWAQAASGPPRAIADLLAQLDRERPDPARVAESVKALQAEPPPASALKLDHYNFHRARASAARALGDIRTEIGALENTVEAASPGTPEYLQALQELSTAHLGAGSRTEALRLRALAISQSSTDPGRLLTLYLGLVNAYSTSGEIDLLREAKTRMDSNFVSARNSRFAPPWLDFWEGMYSWGLAVALQAERKLTEAETAFRRALVAFERDQPKAVQRAAAIQARNPGQAATMVEISAANWDYAELFFARFLILNNRLDEAELSLRNVLARQLKRLGRYNSSTSQTLTNYAALLLNKGRFVEAAKLAAVSEETLIKVGTVPESWRVVEARRTLGAALAAQEQWPQAAATYQAMRDGLARDPQALAQLGRAEFDWALALVKTGDAAQAIALLAPEIEITRKFFGDDSTQVALLRGVNAMALAAAGRRGEALAEFTTALKVLLDPPPEERDWSPGRALRLRRVLEGYIEFLHEARDDNALRQAGIEPVAESFRAADLARSQGTQRALAQSAARAAADDPAIGALVRKEQDMEQEVSTLYGFLLNQMNLPPEQQLPKVQADMRKRIEQLSQERKALRADIEKRFPRYADLVNPRPATLADARAALRPGEVLVSVLSTSSRSFVWAIGAKGESAFHAAPLGESEIARRVASLRKALDPGDAVEIPAFDVATAHALYAELFAPLATTWQGAHTLVASVSGALGQLPLSILATSPALPARGAKHFEEYRQVNWLARQLAVAYTPSVTAFARLRALPPAAAGRKPLIAFADPVFGAAGRSAGGTRAVSNRLGLRNLHANRLGQDPGQSIEWHEYAELAPLPDTREEVLAIATALGADPKTDVFLGPNATRRNVQQADLAHRRIVAFATHGLIPGDLSGLHQPALALSATQDKESPLLTLEDVLRLKLDADWVVLSACNTAAGDGQGAEAVSGLGRGFFYAGTRALLVTHWPVETVSARLLTTAVFARYARTAGSSRAKALQGAMLELLDHPGTPQQSYAHPLFWAPYALVGDGS